MAIISIFCVLFFSTLLSIKEIPKMLTNKDYRDLSAFLVLLFLGTCLAILKSLDVKLPNPSDWVAWVYSPISDFLKDFLK